MIEPTVRRVLILLALIISLQNVVAGQGTVADYRRAMGLRDKYQALVTRVIDAPIWIPKTQRFWFRRTVHGGSEFVLVDATTREQRAPFDHARLARALTEAVKPAQPYTAVTLPFDGFTFVKDEQAIEFTLVERQQPPAQGPQRSQLWQCTLDGYACDRQERTGGRGGRGGGLAGPVRPEGYTINAEEPRKSPDGTLEAIVHNYNVAVRETGKRALLPLSSDGSEGEYYDPQSLVWSPDSRKLAVYRVRPGHRRYIHYIQSSPEDQLQPKHSSMQYAKPGDVLDQEHPVIFDVDARTHVTVDRALFPHAYDMSRLEWREDSSSVTFEYNQRGHQVYRVIEVNAGTGRARAVISEEPKTFFAYSGKRFRHNVGGGREIIWMSERDGWNHLYLYDVASGAVKNQITRGDWPVRSVVHVDDATRQIWFSASGMHPGKDPYFVHYYRINFDGSGLTPLTTADANHSVAFSPDMSFYVDSYSRLDLAPVTELRRSSDRSLVLELGTADLTGLVNAGWKPPEVFAAKGRDNRTDIWGVIYRPTNFDPSRKYPVIEHIYAGPQGAFVPKSFQAFNPMQAQAEIGFIVVQIDGMGTNYRSKAFHDVAWRNLKDAGFPDRLRWHQAVAAKYPSYDITRVGLYGNSAGGQNALGGLLFFPEFYHAAVSSSGCHDNRMDKIWWNEQWMGWPIGSQYAESSNVDNAYRLRGKILLVVGEMDQNVDPSSTMQVVNQLIKHNKEFDLLVLPGGGHGQGGAYGEHKRFDFFVRHLLGVTPPDWRALEEPHSTSTHDSGK